MVKATFGRTAFVGQIILPIAQMLVALVTSTHHVDDTQPGKRSASARHPRGLAVDNGTVSIEKQR